LLPHAVLVFRLLVHHGHEARNDESESGDLENHDAAPPPPMHAERRGAAWGARICSMLSRSRRAG